MKNNGNILMSIIFAVFISFLGLSLLNLSMLHMRIRSIRAEKLTETGILCRDLLYYLHFFREKILNEDMNSFNQPEQEYFNQMTFPVVASTENNDIHFNHSFSMKSWAHQSYYEYSIKDRIEAKSTRNPYVFRADINIELLNGKIPVTCFPFLLKQSPSMSLKTYLEQNNIKDETGVGDIHHEISTEMDTAGFLLNNLKISGTILTWRGIREKFGLEPSDQPIPEGLHFALEGTFIRCIFIQGNVQQLVFSTNDRFQRIRVVKDNVTYDFNYIPSDYYFSWLNQQKEEPLLFKELIVVNGNIQDLRQEGTAAFCEQSNIILYATGSVMIQSNLVTANWNYKKIQFTNLVIISAFESLFGNEYTPGIKINPSDATQIQASVLTEGSLINNSSTLKVSGSVFCEDILNRGVIEISNLKSQSNAGDFFNTTDYKYIRRINIPAIEEVENEAN